jgi:phosphoribosyl-AMP cyclohydrolase
LYFIRACPSGNRFNYLKRIINQGKAFVSLIDKVKFDEKGLVTAIAQDAATGRVLMVAYMNRETLRETVETGRMVYWSRSRKKRWLKGETSGHFQTVKELYIDCDGDVLLFAIEQNGCACHEGYFSCFYRKRVGQEWITVDTPLDTARKDA